MGSSSLRFHCGFAYCAVAGGVVCGCAPWMGCLVCLPVESVSFRFVLVGLVARFSRDLSRLLQCGSSVGVPGVGMWGM